MSNFVMNTAPLKRSNRASIRGIGNGSGTVTALSRWKSTHSRPVPSDFGTKSMGAAQALVLSSIMPSANKDSICKLTDRNLSGCRRYDACLTDSKMTRSWQVMCYMQKFRTQRLGHYNLRYL